MIIPQCVDFVSSRVHGPDDSQDAVFEEVKPLLTSLLDGCVYSNTPKNRPQRVSTVTSSPSLQLQRVHHGVRTDRQREDTHHDGITAAGGALRDAAGDTAGHHPQGGRWTLSVRWEPLDSLILTICRDHTLQEVLMCEILRESNLLRFSSVHKPIRNKYIMMFSEIGITWNWFWSSDCPWLSLVCVSQADLWEACRQPHGGGVSDGGAQQRGVWPSGQRRAGQRSRPAPGRHHHLVRYQPGHLAHARVSAHRAVFSTASTKCEHVCAYHGFVRWYFVDILFP